MSVAALVRLAGVEDAIARAASGATYGTMADIS